MTAITDLDPKAIREVISGFPPMAWMKDDRVICVRSRPLLVRTFCELGSIPMTRRFDAWGALCEPYLDTELSQETHESLLAALKQNGFEEGEVKEIRRRIAFGLTATTFLSWEWQYYGLDDVRRSGIGIFGRLRDGGKAFEKWTSEIASRPWKREISSGQPTTFVPSYTPPRYGLKGRMNFPALIERDSKRPFYEDFKVRFDAEERIVETVTHSVSDPSRHYHNIRHLEEALELGSESHRGQRKIGRVSEQRDARGYRNLWWAILFHDSIYVPGRADNEHLSAQLAVETMRRHGLRDKDCREVFDLIMFTRHHDRGQARTPELRAMHDGDLGIFGLWPARHEEYRDTVRKEWVDSGVVDPAQFNRGRLVFLEKMLEQHRGRPFYFGLDPLFSKLAEENISGEIEDLKKLVS